MVFEGRKASKLMNFVFRFIEINDGVVVVLDDGHGVPEVGVELEDHFPSHRVKVLQACQEDKVRKDDRSKLG